MELALVIIIIIIFYFVVTLVPLVLNGLFLRFEMWRKVSLTVRKSLQFQSRHGGGDQQRGLALISPPPIEYILQWGEYHYDWGEISQTKVHNKTVGSLIGSYARVRVEIDLRKPLNPFVVVGKNDYYIEYEHVHLICFSCGWVGHGRENCYNSWTLWHKACSLQRVWAMWRLKWLKDWEQRSGWLGGYEELPQ